MGASLLSNENNLERFITCWEKITPNARPIQICFTFDGFAKIGLTLTKDNCTALFMPSSL